MRVLELNKIEGNMYKSVLIGDHCEWFTKNSTIFIDNEKYKIKETKCRGFDRVPRVYDIILEHKPQLTKFNYNSIEFLHISKIERIEGKKIQIRTHQIIMELPFDSAEECLNEFLQLKKMHKEALSSG